MEIIKALEDFEDNDFARVFDKWHFYYNKQAIMLTNVDSQGQFISEKIKLKPTRIVQTGEEGTIELTTFELSDSEGFTSSETLTQRYERIIAPAINAFDYKENNLIVEAEGKFYSFDNDIESIVAVETRHATSLQTRLGCGKIQIKSTFKKSTKTTKDKYSITVEIVPDLQKDYEIIPYSPNEEENCTNIANFMAKYVTRPFEYLDNTIGVEINFNKIFYKPEKLEAIQDLLADLAQLENELKTLEADLSLWSNTIHTNLRA